MKTLIRLFHAPRAMLKGKLIGLRQLEEEDLPALRDWRNSEDVQNFTREYRLLNMVNQKRWFYSLFARDPPYHLMFGVVTRKGKLIGCCGLTYINWKERSAEVSIYIGEANWQGRGAGKETLRLLMNYGFNELGLNRIWAEIYAFNDASVRLFEGAGFKREGVLRDQAFRKGRFHNSYVYSVLRREFPKLPS